MSISIVLPCYAPSEGWATNIIQRFAQVQEGIQDDIELIIVQDGNNEKLEEDIALLVRHIPGIQWISYPVNKGKGYAIRKGVEKSTGDIIIYTDIDLPYTNESICSVYIALANNTTDIAIGVKDEAYYVNVSFSRRFISRCLRWMIRNFLAIPITDTQCGLKGFRKKVAPVFLSTQINRYLFDIEFIRESYRKGYTLKAIPISLKSGVQFTRVNYKILVPELLNFIRLMFK